MTTATDKDTLGKALGRITSGIYVMTTTPPDAEPMGILASFVMQAGFEPPRLTVAVGQDREVLKHLRAHGRFVINVLSDSNANLMGRFAKFKPDQFADLAATDTPYGKVLDETVAYICCEVKEIFEAGDHVLVLGEAASGEIINPDLTPWTHQRKNGFSY